MLAKIGGDFDWIVPALGCGVFCGWPIGFALFAWANRKRPPEPERDDYADREGI